MQKAYCDLCGIELSERTLIGQMMHLVLTHQLSPSLPATPLSSPLADPQDSKQAVTQSIAKEEWDLCEDCQKWIWEQAKQHKEELQKDAEHIKALNKEKENG